MGWRPREGEVQRLRWRHVTSYVERQNLTMRMSMRRLTRLTNGFSKKMENLVHAMSLHYMHYNFVRIDKTLRVAPAMAAGVTDWLWSIADIVELVDQREATERELIMKRLRLDPEAARISSQRETEALPPPGPA